MPLLPSGKLPKLLLGNAGYKPLQSAKDLRNALRIHHIPIWFPDQGLDLDQAIANQVATKAFLDLLEDQAAELFVLTLLAVENLIHKSHMKQFFGRNALAHDQRLVGLGDAHSLDERTGCEALGDEADAGERGEEEGVGDTVNEIRERDQGGGQADSGAIERRDEDLGVGVESMRDVEVVNHEGAQQVLCWVAGIGWRPAASYISAAGVRQSVRESGRHLGILMGAYAEKYRPATG
jgi:hypothetical protein